MKLTDMTNKEAQIKLGKIGLVAGNGNFPIDFVKDMKKNKTPFAVAAIKKHAKPELKEVAGENYMEAKIGRFSDCVKFFKKQGVHTVVMIGGVKKQNVTFWDKISFETIKFALSVLTYKKRHDAVFRVIISKFEKKGFRFVGVQDAMPSLLSKQGLLTKTKPTEQDEQDIRMAIQESKKLGMTDIGQAAIVKDCKLLGWEDSNGTDNLINRALAAKNNTQGGVMAKLTKPGQEERGDIPAIGMETLKNLIKCKLNGIVVEGEYQTVFEDKENLIKEFDKNNIFLLVI